MSKNRADGGAGIKPGSPPKIGEAPDPIKPDEKPSNAVKVVALMIVALGAGFFIHLGVFLFDTGWDAWSWIVR